MQLDPLGSCNVEIQFLPFEVGYWQCSVLFLSEEIGEFLYSIEAESTAPLPTEVPFRWEQKSRSSSRVTSALAVQHSQGLLKEDQCVIYLHCEAGKESVEDLNLPVRNAAKERALCEYFLFVNFFFFSFFFFFTWNTWVSKRRGMQYLS